MNARPVPKGASRGLQRFNGATADDYRNAGLPYRPRGAPFQSIDELRLVIGMPGGIYDQLRSAVTVYSQYNAVDPNLAPRLVLRAIPGESDADVEDTLARRSGGPASGTGDASPGKIALSVPLAGRAFGISVAAGEEERAGRVEIIRLTADPTRPYLVLGSW